MRDLVPFTRDYLLVFLGKLPIQLPDLDHSEVLDTAAKVWSDRNELVTSAHTIMQHVEQDVMQLVEKDRSLDFKLHCCYASDFGRLYVIGVVLVLVCDLVFVPR